MQKEIITKKIFTDRVRTYLEKDELEDLIKLFPGAEEAKVAEALLKKASIKIGEYLVKEKRDYEAIIFFNKARVKDPKSKSVFQSFIETVDKFFKENVEEFSKKDLEEFKQVILPIINFHKLKYPEHKKIVQSTDHLLRRIDYRIKYVAKDVQESRVTFRVQQIKNSLYNDDMTLEQVHQEAARLLAPTLRRMYDEYEKKEGEGKDKKKKATDKKKKGKKKKE